MVLWAVVEVGIYQELRVRDILIMFKHKLQIKYCLHIDGVFLAISSLLQLLPPDPHLN